MGDVRTSSLDLVGITLRSVEPGDVSQVVVLVRDVLGEFGLDFGCGCSTDLDLEALPGSYVEKGGAFWVAEDDATGRILGTVGVIPVGPDEFELRKMYLAPSTRGKGVGRAFLEEAIRFVRERGARRMVLDTVEEMKRAIAFYESHGFQRDDAQVRASRCTRGYVRDL